MRPIICFVLLSLAGTSAFADLDAAQREEARKHYLNGTRKYDVAKYAEAADEFQKAYEIVADPVILYNIAQAYRGNKEFDKALTFYKSYLRRSPDAPNRPEVEKRIAEVKELAELQRKSEQTQRPEPIIIHDQKPPLERVIIKEVEVEKSHPPPKGLKWAGIALLGVGVAALAVGGGMSGAALSASNTVQKAAAAGMVFNPSLQSTEASGKLYDNVSYAMYAVGGAALIAGAVSLGIALAKPKASTRAAVVPLLSRDLAGLAVGKAF